MKKSLVVSLSILFTHGAHVHAASTYLEKRAAYREVLHEVMRCTPPELEQRLRSRFDEKSSLKADAFLAKEFKEFCQENHHQLNASLQKLYSSLIASESELSNIENKEINQHQILE